MKFWLTFGELAVHGCTWKTKDSLLVAEKDWKFPKRHHPYGSKEPLWRLDECVAWEFGHWHPGWLAEQSHPPMLYGLDDAELNAIQDFILEATGHCANPGVATP